MLIFYYFSKILECFLQCPELRGFALSQVVWDIAFFTHMLIYSDLVKKFGFSNIAISHEFFVILGLKCISSHILTTGSNTATDLAFKV